MIPISQIKFIPVHYSASSRDFTTFDQVNFWHKEKGFNAEKTLYRGEKLHVGYHFFIDGKGNVIIGRKRYGNFIEIPAANYGLNPYSLAICVALKPGENLNLAQRISLKKLLKEQMKIYNVPVEKRNTKNIITAGIIGHRDVATIINDKNAATSCPGDILYKELQKIKLEILNNS